MSTTQFAFSAAPIRKIKEVQFGILSPEEIVRRPFVPEFYLFADSCYVFPESVLGRQD
jgi:hypothetical protein